MGKKYFKSCQVLAQQRALAKANAEQNISSSASDYKLKDASFLIRRS